MSQAAARQPETEGEFELRDEDFNALRTLVKQHTGINLGAEKRALVYSRLARRLRALGLDSFKAYRRHLEQGDGAELAEFRNAVTTNLTSFFREAHHFEYLRDRILRPRMAETGGSRRLRIWSAGCSTGEEPYSIAITVLETLRDLRQWDVRILATDLDSQVLATASRGAYAQDRIAGLSPERKERFFSPPAAGAAPAHTAAAELRELITFKQLNLMNELPMKGPFDAIFCRNVVIYFDKETQRGLFARMARLQRPGDLLFIGHSENLSRISDAYTLLGKTLYRRN